MLSFNTTFSTEFELQRKIYMPGYRRNRIAADIETNEAFPDRETNPTDFDKLASKDIIQTDREYARRSSRARSTRGQENEAWALYKKIPSRESWGDLSGDRYLICPKPPSLAGKILDRRQLFFLANHNSSEQTPDTRLNLNGYKLKIIKPG